MGEVIDLKSYRQRLERKTAREKNDTKDPGTDRGPQDTKPTKEKSHARAPRSGASKQRKAADEASIDSSESKPD